MPRESKSLEDIQVTVVGWQARVAARLSWLRVPVILRFLRKFPGCGPGTAKLLLGSVADTLLGIVGGINLLVRHCV